MKAEPNLVLVQGMLRDIPGDAGGWAAPGGNRGWNGFPHEVEHTEDWAALLG